MKNDPLLGKNWEPPVAEQASQETVPTSSRAPRREKHPALSSRILATGFSVAAVLGMSTAYAKAQKSQDLQKLIDEQIAAAAQNAATPTVDSSSNVQSQAAPSDLAPAVTPNTTPTVQDPSVTTTPNTTATTTPNVVQVPVQPAQPATPAYNPPSYNRGSQSSGGSR